MHGLNNNFLYSAKKVIAHWSDGVQTVELRGTGFFIVKNEEIFLITNRHVVQPGYSDPRLAGFKIESFKIEGYSDFNENGMPTKKHVADVENFNEFVFSKNPHNDIACLKNAHLKNGDMNITCHIPYNMLATDEWTKKHISVCDSIAYPGFPEWYDRQNDTPIFRMGTIASDPRLNYSYSPFAPVANRIAYEGFSSGGASGSPVFSLQKGFQLGGGLEYSGKDDFYREVKMIGINAGHFEDTKGHSGISYFYKSSAILEIIDNI